MVFIECWLIWMIEPKTKQMIDEYDMMCDGDMKIHLQTFVPIFYVWKSNCNMYGSIKFGWIKPIFFVAKVKMILIND